MKLADAYPEVAGAIVVVCMVTLSGFVEFKPDIRASVSRGKDEVAFHDTGFDQKLNFLNIDGTLERTTDPNFPDPETWEKRYQEARKEYITGRKPITPAQ